MSQKKFVRGTARKQVARPEPPHEDRRTKRNRTRQAIAAGAIDESAKQSEHFGDGRHCCGDGDLDYGPWDD